MTQKQTVLRLLQDNPGGVTTADFCSAHVPRFSARIEELRKEGHRISSQRVREGQWRYRLSGGAARFVGAFSSHTPKEPQGSAAPAESLFDLPPETRSAITGQPLPHRKDKAA